MSFSINAISVRLFLYTLKLSEKSTHVRSTLPKLFLGKGVLPLEGCFCSLNHKYFSTTVRFSISDFHNLFSEFISQISDLDFSTPHVLTQKVP